MMVEKDLKIDEQPDLSAIADVDRLIHEPARLIIMTILNTVASADFLYLLRESKLTKGNLSAHLSKLEKAKYISIEKAFKGKIPHTVCRIQDLGREAYAAYVKQVKMILK